MNKHFDAAYDLAAPKYNSDDDSGCYWEQSCSNEHPNFFSQRHGDSIITVYDGSITVYTATESFGRLHYGKEGQIRLQTPYQLDYWRLSNEKTSASYIILMGAAEDDPKTLVVTTCLATKNGPLCSFNRQKTHTAWSFDTCEIAGFRDGGTASKTATYYIRLTSRTGGKKAYYKVDVTANGRICSSIDVLPGTFTVSSGGCPGTLKTAASGGRYADYFAP